MPDPIDKIDISEHGLKSLLDFRYALLLINFVVFSDIIVAVLLKQPLLRVKFGTEENQITIGLSILIIVAFAIYLLVVKHLFIGIINIILWIGNHLPKHKAFKLLRSLLCPNDIRSKIIALIATCEMTEEYAIRTGNSILLSVCDKHKIIAREKQDILFMIFGLALLMASSSVLDMNDSIRFVFAQLPNWVKSLFSPIMGALCAFPLGCSYAIVKDGDRMYELDFIMSDTIRENYQNNRKTWNEKHMNDICNQICNPTP